MTSSEIRTKFLEFFEKRGHVVVPSSSLIPDDPSVLLTTAGMQQFKKYFTGELNAQKDFVLPDGTPALGTASCQKSFRTSDIDEVGDESHLTFFEMLGNFSFGGYFKKEAITYAYDFITKEMGLKISYVTIFEGKDDIGVPKDTESWDIWKSLDPNLKVVEQGMDDVFWGPTGSSGPCGPTTEIYCKNDAMAEPVEVWNIVFNQYFYPGSREELNIGVPGKKLEPLKTSGVDTGMGIERLATVVQGVKTIFETDLFSFIMRGFPDELPIRVRRIIADHVRAIAFLISDGLLPSNKDAGYILRRLMRRVIAFTYEENIGADPVGVLKAVVNEYKQLPDYQNLDFTVVEKVFREEYDKFMKTLASGRKEFEKEADKIKAQGKHKMFPMVISNLHQSSGVTIDILDDFAKKEGVEIDKEAFVKDTERHREISRAGAEAKFGGHGLYLKTGEVTIRDQSEVEKVTRLHTATHLLHQALRQVLGPEVRQNGSDITVERTRFDFNFPRKLTPEELKQVEDLVNQKIKEDLAVSFVELPKAEAEKTGALYFFKEKYPDKVKVYFMGPTIETAWSKEFCGGPHVTHTKEVGAFKITKEEAVGSGLRRIRGTVEP